MKETRIGYEITYPVFQNIEESKNTMYKLALEIKKLDIHPTLCGMGTSGITLCVLLQTELAKLNVDSRIIYIKKENEINHGNQLYNASHTSENIIVVDDLISTGKTIRAIAEGLKELNAIDCVKYVAAQYCNFSESKAILENIFPKINGIFY